MVKGRQILSITVRSTYFFRHLKNWFPHVVQFLASTLASFYTNWHMAFLVHEWASIYKSGKVSSPSSVMCDIPLRYTRIGRNKWRKYMYTYFLFTELSNWIKLVQRVMNIIITVKLSLYYIFSYNYWYFYDNDNNNFINVSNEVWRGRKKRPWRNIHDI